ncbi:MAG TPA: hypothetical protein VME18_05575 [Acidobacteriaceae bacterium]|nr:hypothetical protein [Acidobacteriaceae bacterium]
MTEKELTKRLMLRSGLPSVASLVVIFALLAGWLPVRFLGLTWIAAIVPFAVIFWSFIRRFSAEPVAETGHSAAAPPDETTGKRTRSNIRKLRIAASAETAVPTCAFSASRGEPLLQRLVAGGTGILLLYCFLTGAKRLQRQLSESDTPPLSPAG